VTQVRRAYARAFENGFDPRDWTGERDVWRLDDKYHWDRDTTYRYRGPWLEAVGSSVRYVFEGDRPVRRQLKPGLIFWDDDHNSIWTWAGDRVSTYLWTGYVQRFEYDAAGRLVLDRLDEKDRTVRIWTFEYDARGAVRRSVDKQSSGSSGSTDARISTYQYDESGREISVSYDRQFTPAPQTPGWSNPGPVSYKTTYSGDCAKVTEAPLVPNVFEIMHAAPCFQSPGKLFEQCHWGGWFRPAQR
jgi:hypothetical protein